MGSIRLQGVALVDILVILVSENFRFSAPQVCTVYMRTNRVAGKKNVPVYSHSLFLYFSVINLVYNEEYLKNKFIS